MSQPDSPLFILSFRQRDELALLAEGAGWRVVAARRTDGAARRFRASRARVAVVDARGAFAEGLAAVGALGQAALAARAALLVLVSRGDVARLGEMFADGATHFLTSRFGDGELLDALRFAHRHAERMADPEAGIPSPGAAYLGAELRRALDAGEIDMLFQPQVQIDGGAIVGVEALMRWNAAAGPIGAEALLDTAEQAGLVAALSAHVQARALAAAAAWPDALAGLRLSINVTADDLAQPGFLGRFLDRVAASGFPRERLTVEITETGLIADRAAAAVLLAGLRAAGCRVAIDDFGTGYSSLAYLKDLPLDVLKIDRRLSQDITGSPRDRVVVKGVIAMARSLGLTVVAEGVETERELELLAREGCDLYQGFLCSEPVDVAGLLALVEAGRR